MFEDIKLTKQIFCHVFFFFSFLFRKHSFFFYTVQRSLKLGYLQSFLFTWIIVNYSTDAVRTLANIIPSSFTPILISGIAWKEVAFPYFLSTSFLSGTTRSHSSSAGAASLIFFCLHNCIKPGFTFSASYKPKNSLENGLRQTTDPPGRP